MRKIIEKASLSHYLDKNEIVQLLTNDNINDFLFKTADAIRQKYVGNEVHLRGLIEFSNICKQNCKYCGLRKDNLNIERYHLDADKVLEFVKKATVYGFKTIVLQSGENAYFNTDRMCSLIKSIKNFDVAITLSIGEKTFDEYKAYKEAGADRYLLRIETTDRNLYKKMHPHMDFDNRIKCLENLRILGYEVGTGCLIGLPEQTVESIADDIIFFKNMNADMIGLGPFIPNPDTPLKDTEGGSLVMALKAIAITRLLLPDINIPATTAMETLNPEGRIMALQCGANVVMPNVTEGDYRQKYELYPGKIAVHDTPEECKDFISQKIYKIGRTISTHKGFRKKNV